MDKENKEYCVLVSRWHKEDDAPTNYSILKFINKSPEWIQEYLDKNYKHYICEHLETQVID